MVQRDLRGSLSWTPEAALLVQPRGKIAVWFLREECPGDDTFKPVIAILGNGCIKLVSIIRIAALSLQKLPLEMI